VRAIPLVEWPKNNKGHCKAGKYLIYKNNPPVHRPTVYMLQNIKTGRAYIGSTKDLCLRVIWRKAFPKEMLAIIEQEGKSAFVVIPLYIGFTEEAVREAEPALIRQYNTVETGYNLMYEPKGRKNTAKAIAKMRVARKIWWETDREIKTAEMVARFNAPTILRKKADSVAKSWIKRRERIAI
jgi:hypothetical protein